MNKRGISAIVATVLIILITVASVTILWSVIIPMIQDNLDFSSLEGRVSVVTSEGYTYYDADSELASVQVKRDVDDGVMNRIKIAFSVDGDDFSSSVAAPESGSTRVYLFDLSDYGETESVSVAPIFAVENREKEGPETSAVVIGKEKVAAGSDYLGTVYSLGEDYTFDIEEGLVVHWKFEGNGGDSAGHYNLNLNGNANFDSIDGRNGANFSGDQNSYMYSSLGQELSPDENSFSYALWLYPRNFTSRDRITQGSQYTRFIGLDNYCGGWQTNASCTWFVAQLSSSGAISFSGRGYNYIPNFGIATPPNMVSLNKWYHIAYVFNRSENMHYIYINGSEYKSIEKEIGSLNMTADLRIPSSYAETDGLLDDFMIYDRALSAEEVKNLYDVQKG